ncbi:unnamed protein product [Trichogramma brassicae]|uniref:C2H2-type domain-containing protein n=1 Tax=Trichogramma brassicae TaxID=86971 RepID=A0A6H5IV30_9HYME|nr:unnamed protein product [Trichogramma brassicae]
MKKLTLMILMILIKFQFSKKVSGKSYKMIQNCNVKKNLRSLTTASKKIKVDSIVNKENVISYDINDMAEVACTKCKVLVKKVNAKDLKCSKCRQSYTYTCLGCKTQFQKIGSLRMHYNRKHGPKLFSCQRCNPRSGSQATLDSLDMTRFSEDGGGVDERVAVLEFELRKAKENINSLRANLTICINGKWNLIVNGIGQRWSRCRRYASAYE